MTWDVPYADSENQPPELTNSPVPEGALITLAEPYRFYIEAEDQDSQGELLFSWKAGGQILFDQRIHTSGDSGEGVNVWTSLVEIPYDPELDGRTLDCTIYDEQGAHTPLSWPLEVL